MLSSAMNLSSTGLPTTVIAGGNDTRHQVCIDPSIQMAGLTAGGPTAGTPSVSPTPPPPAIRSINPRQGGRRNKSYVDPCEIAPLKKRRIQVCV